MRIFYHRGDTYNPAKCVSFTTANSFSTLDINNFKTRKGNLPVHQDEVERARRNKCSHKDHVVESSIKII